MAKKGQASMQELIGLVRYQPVKRKVSRQLQKNSLPQWKR